MTVKEHFTGFQVLQRGVTFYLTRVSPIRNTAQYSQYTWCIWNKDHTAQAENNPAVSFRLFRDRWYEWLPVELNN